MLYEIISKEQIILDFGTLEFAIVASALTSPAGAIGRYRIVALEGLDLGKLVKYYHQMSDMTLHVLVSRFTDLDFDDKMFRYKKIDNSFFVMEVDLPELTSIIGAVGAFNESNFQKSSMKQKIDGFVKSLVGFEMYVSEDLVEAKKNFMFENFNNMALELWRKRIV